MPETAEDQEKEQRKEREAMMARKQVKAKILSTNSMATVETVESTVTGTKTCRTTCSTTQTEKGQGSARKISR